MKLKRFAEFLAVLSLVALVLVWLNRPETSADETPLPGTASPTGGPSPESRPVTLLDGYELGTPRPDTWPEETVLEFDEAGKICLIRGSELEVNGEVKVHLGDTHDMVKAKMGKPSAFAHGGAYWGYWSMTRPTPSKGLLVKFSTEGVERITLASDWVPLSTELALSRSEVVDGSDGYKDVREFLEK